MPNTNLLLRQLALSSADDLAAMLQDEHDSQALAALLGAETVWELQNEARMPSASRAGGPPLQLAILPGLMGSLLQSTRGRLELLWINPMAILKGLINLLEMAPDGQQDASPDVQAQATGIELVVYARWLLAARQAGRVLIFPYDWRRDIRVLAQRLKDSIDHWTHGGTTSLLTLVGHSMGGVVSLAYLALFPAHAERHVQRLIMMGTPVRGAAVAVLSLAYGSNLMELAQRINGDNDTLRMVRSLPSLYQLLPAPRESFPGHLPYPLDFDAYQAANWPMTGLHQHHLDAARSFQALLAASDPQLPIVQIAGCNVPTHVGVTNQGNVLRGTVVSNGPSSGDGTVPLWSSTLRNGQTYYVPVEHLKLPMNRDVIDATLGLARGEVPPLDTEVPETRGPVTVQPAPDLDAEAARLRSAIETGTMTADDLRQLFFLT